MTVSTKTTRQEPLAEQMLTEEGAELTPWTEVTKRFDDDSRTSYWLSTVRPDGRLHVVPLGAIWLDDALYFTTGQGTRKGKNLASSPHCNISFSCDGLDITIEGDAVEVSDVAKLTRVAARYAAHGWPAFVNDGVLDAPYSAPTTGPAPYDVFEMTPRTAFAFGTTDDNYKNATRYSW